MRLLTGTSGFAYKEWKGDFYPQDLPASGMLRHYAKWFPAVEINNTFYRMPSDSVLRKWADEVPPDFTFVLKSSQQITHRKRLKEIDEPVARFFQAAQALEGRLGPVLFQLPPNLKKDLPRLVTFLHLVPRDARIDLEFRHPSWFDDHVFDALRAHHAALCIAHDEREAPMVATADWGYLRLRRVVYNDEELSEWVRDIRAQEWSEAYVFFKHEATGTGPRLARRFDEIFRGAGA